MTDREKVIKGLEACMNTEYDELCPDECPYRKDICCGSAWLMADALELLKAQKPRVMTLEEATLKDHVWFEPRGGVVIVAMMNYDMTGNVIAVLKFGLSAVYVDPIEYGIKWRCWTKRPTDEQREAVKWE